MYRGEACVQRGDLSTKVRDLSTEGETHLRRVRLVYGGGRLVYRGRDSSVEGHTRIQRGRLVYGGGDTSTEGETRLGTEICTFFTSTLVRQTRFAYNFFVCIFSQLFQRIRNQREILRFLFLFSFFAKKSFGLFWLFLKTFKPKAQKMAQKIKKRI